MRVTYNGSRIMRSDYDKPHRCPGWSGAGWKYNKTENEVDCPSGSVGHRYEKKLWRFRSARCPQCSTIALPVVLDPAGSSTCSQHLRPHRASPA